MFATLFDSHAVDAVVLFVRSLTLQTRPTEALYFGESISPEGIAEEKAE